MNGTRCQNSRSVSASNQLLRNDDRENAEFRCSRQFHFSRAHFRTYNCSNKFKRSFLGLSLGNLYPLKDVRRLRASRVSSNYFNYMSVFNINTTCCRPRERFKLIMTSRLYPPYVLPIHYVLPGGHNDYSYMQILSHTRADGMC